MPVYEYRCERGHTFEALQRFSDDPVTGCTTCDATVQRVLQPVAVHFKGSGFYSTDYGRKKDGADPGSKDGGDPGSPDDSNKKETPDKAGSKSSSSDSKSSGSESGPSKSGSSD